MNHALIIKVTNRIAFYATLALLLWVVVFLTVTVFDLKIFRDRITETFSLSILGIFAILGGSLVLNVMSNLSRISEAVSEKVGMSGSGTPISKWKMLLVALTIPAIFGFLFAGDALSDRRKQELLMTEATAIVSENKKELETLANYEFTKDYLAKSSQILSVLEKIDSSFPEVEVILLDNIDGKNVFMGFRKRDYPDKDESPKKQDYIFSTSKEDRAYLESIFSGGKKDRRFLTKDNNYMLYVPVNAGGKIMVLYFSDYQRYGKSGSS